MNNYIIIRSDNKSISPPMSKHEAVKKLREYDKEGISSYLIYRNDYLEFDYVNRLNVYEEYH
ncbi:hypothetical protein [Asaccharospora irregularis]|uniref:Uncharacterized protein n=1 Tax=Asaccharospora irregularis DSM 2635 TaxID=1121321 RepID=A0A1M5N8Z6_9FIRM|nr:hypothetical protein [Asaccharospora irregularis]SHG85967.1 hypothetical protein SAMN04488530_10953 [Asaccharospora irregularis DSM 2635]